MIVEAITDAELLKIRVDYLEMELAALRRKKRMTSRGLKVVDTRIKLTAKLFDGGLEEMIRTPDAELLQIPNFGEGALRRFRELHPKPSETYDVIWDGTKYESVYWIGG